MKKFLLAAICCLFATVTFAQDYKHAIGLRVGNGAELQYEYHMNDKNFLKADAGLYGFGKSFFGSCTYNWNCCRWDWTPKAGTWFLSAGVGASVGAYAEKFNVGVAGDVAFGIDFKGAPFGLALDYRPTIFLLDDWGSGFANICLSCVFRF